MTLRSLLFDCPNSQDLISDPSRFPNLNTITIHDDVFDWLSDPGVAHFPFPTITHIGVIPQNSLIAVSALVAVEWILDSGNFGALKVIRMLGQVGSNPSFTRARWETAAHKCRLCRVRLENRYGEVLLEESELGSGQV